MSGSYGVRRSAIASNALRARRLQREKREAAGRIVRRDEAHRAVAQVADAVEQHDRARLGHGVQRAYFFANESLTSVATRCVSVVTDSSTPS